MTLPRPFSRNTRLAWINSATKLLKFIRKGSPGLNNMNKLQYCSGKTFSRLLEPAYNMRYQFTSQTGRPAGRHPRSPEILCGQPHAHSPSVVWLRVLSPFPTILPFRRGPWSASGCKCSRTMKDEGLCDQIRRWPGSALTLEFGIKFCVAGLPVIPVRENV